MSFPRYMAERGLIDASSSNEIDELVSGYRRGAVTYRQAAEAVPKLYAMAVRGLELRLVEAAAEAFMRDYVPGHIYGYAPELIRLARERFNLVVALSGSPSEPIRRLLGLGFHEAVGSVFEVRSGVFTGAVTSNLIAGEEKAWKLREVAEALGVDLSRSAAFGDSDQDAPALDEVGYPVPVNPNAEMKRICEERGWRWLTERDLPQGVEDLLSNH